MAVEDGGSAFPLHVGSGEDGIPISSTGMSLRDYFAAHDKSKMPTSDEWAEFAIGQVGAKMPCLTFDERAACVAKWKFMVADEMLKLRQ